MAISNITINTDMPTQEFHGNKSTVRLDKQSVNCDSRSKTPPIIADESLGFTKIDLHFFGARNLLDV